MSTELLRLKASDYDELMDFLNRVFTIQNKRETDFEKILPKMCIPDDEHMGKHLGIKKDGKLVAAAGIYPLPAKVCGQELMFSTVGNIATAPEEEGKGYMSLLLKEAMKELERIGADASRLSGARQRYNRFGYECAGWTYDFILRPYNVKYMKPKFESNISFSPVSSDDKELLSAMMKIHNKGKFTVERKNSIDFYLTLIAWECTPYVAKRPDGSVVGYISAYSDKKGITEACASTPEDMRELLVQWVATYDTPILFSLMPHRVKEIQLMSAICDEVSVSSPSSFKIINWDKVVGAFLKLKSEYEILPDMDFTVEIEEYGSIRVRCKDNFAECTKTDEPGDIKLDSISATRYFFDPITVEFADRPNVLPLPISWNYQDRV